MRHESSGPPRPISFYPDDVTYFIQAEHGGPVKIGRSRKLIVHNRLADLQIGNPHKLVVRKVIDGNHEGRLHWCYRDQRLRGEWFEVDQILAREGDAKRGKVPKDSLAVEKARKDGFREGWRQATARLAESEAEAIADLVKESLRTSGVRSLIEAQGGWDRPQ